MKISFPDHGVNRKVVDNDKNYEISAKSNDAFTRKWPKTSFFKKLFIKKISDFSAKIGLRHFSTFITG